MNQTIHRILTHRLLSAKCALIISLATFLESSPAETSASFKAKLSMSTTSIDRQGSLPNSFADVIETVRPAVVSISTSRNVGRRSNDEEVWDDLLREFFGDEAVPPQGHQAPPTRKQQQGLGSGVLVTSDGYIITNNHVIKGADEILVTLPTTKTQYEASVVAADPSTDVALLRIDEQNLPHATLADSEEVRVGDVVLAIGNPFELAQTVTQGIVSALGRSNVMAGELSYANFIQTDASINPGNSGGALVDSSGRVIGINTMIYSNTGSSMGIGFAIPINMALQVIDSLLDWGEVSRGYLGVRLDEVDANIARSLGRRDLYGAVVAHVEQGSPAEQAGIQPGDLIIEFEGRPVPDLTKLRLHVGNTPPGSQVNFGIFRDGRTLDIPVMLTRRPNEGEPFAPAFPRQLPPLAERRSAPPSNQTVKVMPFYLTGVTLATLDGAARDRLGLDDAYEGAIVTAVDPNSAAARGGLQPDDVIVEVGRQQVASMDEVINAGSSVTGDSVILGVIRRGREEFLLINRQ